MFLVFSTDDRSPSASTNQEKQNKTPENNQQPTNEVKEERIKSPEGTKRSDTNFLQRNIDRIRTASLRIKYKISSNTSFNLILFSRENRKDEDNLVFVTMGPIYPYSTQKLNSTENALEQMRTYLKQV